MKHTEIIHLLQKIGLVLCLIPAQFLEAQTTVKEPIEKVIVRSLEFCQQQSLLMARSLADIPGVLPKTTDRFGNLETCNPNWWVSGFFPGQLWYLHEYSDNPELLKWAREYTTRVAGQQYNRNSHDVGFMVYCSAGNGYRITGDTLYKRAVYNAASSLATRFNEKIGCTRSWDPAPFSSQWQFAVIIDNMMNLELLMKAAELFNEPRFRQVAVTHANTTLKNHYRPDYSCYHVVSYDTITGKPEKKQTAQGYADNSAWARGQAWGLYGYTLMYRFTKDTAYLNLASHIARYLIHHPNMPPDYIPYWDFNAPNIPDAYRDASAAAIMCAALIELSGYVDDDLSGKLLGVAEIQLRTLSTPQYMNAPGNNGNFLLKHSVGHMPNNTEVDVPLTYADYYYVEALLRYFDYINAW